MIILANTTDSIQVVLTGTVEANQIPCYASYRDTESGATLVPDRSLVSTNNTTAVTLVSAPGSGVQRGIDTISVTNTDTAGLTVIVQYDVNGTPFEIGRALIGPGERFAYSNGGWNTFANTGALKTSVNQGSSPVQSDNTRQVLASDVTASSPTANTLFELTGLGVPVTAGNTYYFSFFIKYTSQATSNGSRWVLDGPSFSDLTAASKYTLTATTQTQNTVNAYNFPTASNASSAGTAGNWATIDGFITASANGTLIVKFAAELANNFIVAKAGSFVEYFQIS